MQADRLERARWIARWILPVESALRTWLRHRVRGGTGIEIDDIVQESYAVLSELATVDHIRSPRNYLFQIAHSIVLAHHRRSKIVRIDYLAELERLEVMDDAVSPEIETFDRHELRRLGEMLLELPSRQREAFSLRKLEELSQREAAERMRISESTLEKHVAKALYYLTQRLGRSGRGDAQASRPEVADETYASDATRKQ